MNRYLAFLLFCLTMLNRLFLCALGYYTLLLEIMQSRNLQRYLVIFLLLYQPALSEYDFTIRSLFEDLQDGIILCRVVQLLLSDASIIVVRNCVILG
jgi:hypothetical protein